MSLPVGWGSADVEELAGPNGFVSDGDWVESKDQDIEGSVRLTQLADVGEGVFRNRSRRFMTLEAANRLRCSFLKAGDVLIARMPDPLGRACVFPGVGQPAVTAVDVLIWRTDSRISEAAWFVKWINSPQVRALLIAKAGGTTRQRVAGGRIKEMQLPLPPLAEQRRIVAKLDALNVRLARARTDLERVSVDARKLKQAALSQYITSAIVGTEKVDFGSKIALLTSGSRDWAKYYDQGTCVFVLAGNVRPLRFDPTPKRFVNPPLDSADARRSRIEQDDLLLTIVGAGTGDICHIDASFSDYFVCQSVARIKLKDPTLAEFYQYWFVSEEYGGKDFSGSIYGAARPHLSFDQINGFSVPNVSAEVARSAVVKIRQAFDRAAHLEAESSRAGALIDRLESALLSRAFRGELVPQDPNDEPSSMMLDRIRADSLNSPQQSRSRRAKA